MPETDLELLIEASQEAAQIALHHWKSDQKIIEKPDGAGPVSEGDLAVDAYLHKTLRAARPDYGWLSEETTDTAHRLDKKRVFIVDPIDGTRSYIAGERTWALSIAVVEEGQPIAGVVHLPARDKLYSAAHGTGAFLNANPITTSQRAQPVGGTILAPKSNLNPDHWPGGVPDMSKHFRPSLAYRLSLIAEGRFDAMLTLRDTWEWDIAAGALIASEAGATVTEARGKPLVFNGLRAKTSGVLLANQSLHRQLLTRLTA